MKKNLHRAAVILLVSISAATSGCGRTTPTLSPAQTGVSPEQQSADAAGFKEFSNRVNDYVKLHKSQEVLLPALKPTVSPEAINAHQRALSLKIREARPNARPGDIFTPAAQKSFQDVIQSAMQGPRGANMDATLNQGSPLPPISVGVNQPYPDGVAYTTVPPTLLLVLPKLPDEVVYRVVLHDLLLMDLKANLVVDVLPGIIP
jgi:hypothetical protein